MKKPYSTPQLVTLRPATGPEVALGEMAQGYREGLRDLLSIWDRRDHSGWTAADVRRLAEIRRKARA